MSTEGERQNVRPASEFISRQWIHPDFKGTFDGCMSNNAPERGGTKPLVNLRLGDFGWESADSVWIDHCIVDAIKSLWKAGIWTLGSCCGHGDVNPSVVLAHWSDGEAAKAILDLEGRKWEIKAWVLSDVPQATGADDALREVLEKILPFAWHKHSCPKRSNLNAPVCDCNFDELRQSARAALARTEQGETP